MSEVAPAPGTAQVPVAVVIGQGPVTLGDVSAQYVEPSKTIFARGLAPALSEFEFIHLFQKHPGFISARVKKNRDGSPIGFAEFDTIEHSVAAKEAVAQERAGTDLVLEYSHTSRRSNRHRHVPFPSSFPQEQKPEFHEIPLISRINTTAPSSTLFVTNVPPDATVREMSHIFRLFDGFRCVRFVPHASRSARYDSLHTPFLCFVEYETPMHATVAMNSLQDYQMDITNPSMPHLLISFARTERKPPQM